MLKDIGRRFSSGIWIYIITVVMTVIVMLSVPVGADSYDDWTKTVMSTLMFLTALGGAALVRYLFIKPVQEPDPRKAKMNRPLWVLMWTLPVAMTIIMLPWLISGILVDRDMTVAGSIFAWLLLSYAALLIGFLLVPFVILPLELIGRSIVAFVRGDKRKGAGMLGIGLYIGAVTMFVICGTLALSDLPPLWLSWGHIIFALLGLSAQYTVDSQLLLWVARILALVLIAVPLSLSAAAKRNG